MWRQKYFFITKKNSSSRLFVSENIFLQEKKSCLFLELRTKITKRSKFGPITGCTRTTSPDKN